MSELEVDTGASQDVKKYDTYSVEVDPAQDDKAKQIKLLSFARPHMRAFHCSWWSFFIACFTWFSIAPLLSEIQETLDLTKQQIWTSSIVGVTGTIVMRFALGPVCDKYGPRLPMAIVLCLCAIPTGMTGLVNSATGLAILRLFIGLAGSAFVMCQFWTSRMFTKDVVGTASALVAGWGNLGGGVTQLVTGSLLFPLFKSFYNGDSEKAWRTVCVVPAVVAFITGIVVYRISEDAPKGNFNEMKKNGTMPEVSAAASFRTGAINVNTWILFVQYACCFGIELTMNNAAALYFKDEFGQSTETAAAIASIFGWMDLFARGFGGYMSDKLNARMGLRGRILFLTVCLACEGAFVLVFAQSGSLAIAIVVMVIFAIFSQAASGTIFSIVPYVNPSSTGSISGIVGAGGNVGAVGFGLGFRQLDYLSAFNIMGGTVLVSSLLGPFIIIKGHSSLFCGHYEPKSKAATLSVPAPDTETKGDVSADA